jgi:uncharacterized protein
MPEDTNATAVFTLLLHGVDTLDWDTVRTCFTPEVATDYTSLWGGEPETLAVDQLVGWWQPFATGFDATQHLTGPIAVVRADGRRATAVTTVRAYHHIAQDEGPAGTWMVAGQYEIALDRGPDGWKVGGVTLTVAYEDGDRALVDVARSRGEARAGGRFDDRRQAGTSGEPDRVGVVRRFFDLLRAKDIDAWGELWAESGRILVFYPPDGFASSIDRRDTIVTGFRTLFANFDTFDPELTAVYPAADSDAVTVEYDAHATLRDGTVYRNRNIAVFRFDGGLITTYHDYFDPRLFQKVVDALP